MLMQLVITHPQAQTTLLYVMQHHMMLIQEWKSTALSELLTHTSFGHHPKKQGDQGRDETSTKYSKTPLLSIKRLHEWINSLAFTF